MKLKSIIITVIIVNDSLRTNTLSLFILSTEPSTKSLVPTIDIRSATRWLWQIILNAWKLY